MKKMNPHSSPLEYDSVSATEFPHHWIPQVGDTVRTSTDEYLESGDPFDKVNGTVLKISGQGDKIAVQIKVPASGGAYRTKNVVLAPSDCELVVDEDATSENEPLEEISTMKITIKELKTMIRESIYGSLSPEDSFYGKINKDESGNIVSIEDTNTHEVYYLGTAGSFEPSRAPQDTSIESRPLEENALKQFIKQAIQEVSSGDFSSEYQTQVMEPYQPRKMKVVHDEAGKIKAIVDLKTGQEYPVMRVQETIEEDRDTLPGEEEHWEAEREARRERRKEEKEEEKARWHRLSKEDKKKEVERDKLMESLKKTIKEAIKTSK